MADATIEADGVVVLTMARWPRTGFAVAVAVAVVVGEALEAPPLCNQS